MMDFSGRQHIPYNREFFVFLPWEKMSVSHRHGDVFVAHELLQLHERNLTRLRQPRGERMPHGMQCDDIQTVAVFRGQIELSDGGLEAGGRLGERRLLTGLLEDGFRRLALVRLEHPDHVLRYSNENPPASFLNDIEAAGVGIHILSAQFENLRGTEAGSQREQGHIVQLGVPLFKVVQKCLGFLSGQKTQSFIIGLDHLPCPALGRQRVDSAPHTGGDSTVYGGSHERKNIVYGLPGQGFPLPRLDVGLSCGLFGLCIPGGRLQELCLETREQIGGQLDNGQSVNFSFEVGAVLTVVLVNVFSFAPAPRKIRVNDLPDGDFITFNGIDAGGLKLGKELCPLLSDRGRGTPLLCLPTVFQWPLPS